MAEKITSEKITSSAEFSAIWKAALVEFYANTNISLTNETKLLNLQNIDELIDYLKKEYAEYNTDSASSSFTNAVKSSLGSLRLLLTTGDRIAGNMFPGGSQVLSALGIFLEAGIAVTKSFEDVAGLFAKIGESTRRMQLVSQENIPPRMIPIYQAMLLTLLKICGLGIKITLRPDSSDEQTKDTSRKHRFSRATRAARANVKEYVRQLTGGNSKVNELVQKLDELVDNEIAMMQAETMTGVLRLKAFSIKIQDLTLELGDTVSRLQSDTADLTFRVTLVQQSQSRIEENTVDIKKAQTQQDAKLDMILQLELQRMTNSGSGKQQNESQETKTSVSEEFKRWKKLAAALGAETARDSNKAFYERIRNERVKGTTEWILEDMAVQNWFRGERSFVVVSGDTGNGKTFIAGRIVEELITNKPKLGGLDKAVAYFFCRKVLGERSSLVLALKTMAYDIAVSDKLFAKHLSDVIKEQKLQSDRPASDTEVIAAKMESITAQYNSIVADSDTVADQASNTASENTPTDNAVQSSYTSDVFPVTEDVSQLTSNTNGENEAARTVSELTAAPVVDDGVELSEEQDLSSESESDTEVAETGFDPKLRRVSTAVLQDTPLDDEDEEATVWDITRHWEQLFVKYPKSFEKHIYLVIDGLDECDETEAIALCAAINAGAGEVAGRPASKVHVLLLMNADRATMFESHALTEASSVSIDSTTVMADVDRYVRKSISIAWEQKLVRSELREDCRKTVLENCDSNFLKASLLVNEVTSLSREDVIRESLSNLPETAKTIQSATLLVIKRLASQLDSYDREDFHDILAWVSCAQRELSLAELDALLTLRKPSGARILDLESKVRETYASLFSVSGEEIFKEESMDELVSSRLDFVKSTRAYKDAMDIHDIVEGLLESPVAQEARSHAAVDKDTLAVRRATANLSNNVVSLSHTMIAEEIQKHIAQAGLTDFTTASMQAIVLLYCIQTLCVDEASHDKRSVKLATGYCGIFLLEHLQSVKPSEVSPCMKIKIAKKLVALLRDPLYIQRWVESGERYLADDLLGSPNFHQKVLEWLEDDTVQSQLSEAERQWYSCAVKSPIATMFEGVAKAVAHRWLTCLHGSDAGADYYGFLKTYQECKDDLKPITEAPSRALRNASTADILRVAESAGLQQNCRWFQRLGSIIRIERGAFEDDEQFNPSVTGSKGSDADPRPDLTYDDAIRMYTRALEIDSRDGVTRSGMAWTFASQAKYEDAAREANAAAELFSDAIQNGEPSPTPEYSLLSYKIDNQRNLASHCIKAGNLDEGFRAYERAIEGLETLDTTGDSWERMLYATASFFYELTSNKKWTEANLLVRRLNAHTHCASKSFHLIYQYTAFSEAQLLQIGYHTKDIETLTVFMNHALSSTARNSSESAVASVVHVFASLLLRLDDERVEEAINILEAVRVQSYAQDYTKSWAEKELARHFLTRILQEREADRWQAVATYAERLIRLVSGDESDLTSPGDSSTESRDCCRMLAAWYHLNGLRDRAKQCVRSDVTLGIDLLSDTDPDNDTMAWYALMDSLLVIGDETRAIAAVNMLRSSLFEDPKPSGKPSDVPGSDGDSTPRSDGDTRTGASDEPLKESPGARIDSTSPSNNVDYADQSRTVEETSFESVSTSKTSTTPELPGEEVPIPSEGTLPVTVGDATHESDQAPETESSSSKEATSDPGSRFFSCDGSCFSMIANNAPLWRCSYCITDFCESCHELIMAKNMTGWNVCDSLHRHVYVPGVIKKYAKDMIKVEDEEMTVAEWVQGLREEWKYFKAGN